MRFFRLFSAGVFFLLLGLSSLTACGHDQRQRQTSEVLQLALVVEHPGAALMAVHGSSDDDVWIVGADDGNGPLVLHYDGHDWARHHTGATGDLWWVQALPSGVVYFAGAENLLLRYQDGAFERLAAPGLARHLIFGLWAASEDELYAVGAIAGRNGFIWHYEDNQFSELAIPRELAGEGGDVPPLFKVAGYGDDVWIVGAAGAVLRGNADDGFSVLAGAGEERLFTVSVSADAALLVGGGNHGTAWVADRSQSRPTFVELAPAEAPLLQGAALSGDRLWATGRGGALYAGSLGGKLSAVGRSPSEVASLHAVWQSESGSVWTVGGQVLRPQLDQGKGFTTADVPTWFFEPEPPSAAVSCPSAEIDPAPDASIARRWNEQILGAIRRDLPRPTVHARNLYHLSLAMWDTWASFEEQQRGLLVKEKWQQPTTESEREGAIAHAAYQVLRHRYAEAVGGETSEACFGALMSKLGHAADGSVEPDREVLAWGDSIGARVVEAFAQDGANEAADYADPDEFRPANPPLVVDDPGTFVSEPSRFQQLLLAEAVTQNGISEGSGVRDYVGAHWGGVIPFALQREDASTTYFEGADPPLELDERLVSEVVDVLKRTSELDIDDGTLIDISPASRGNNSLGQDDGEGHAINPVTSQAYPRQLVLRGDFTRVLAEFWADGPHSETPPGHWNTLANWVAGHPDSPRRLFGKGAQLDPLAWDVHMYLTLNGALHDAAIAAWELKRAFQSARPITLVRYLAGLGQRTDPDLPSYHPDGIPLVENLIEVITDETTASDGRHAGLERYVGEIAVRSWRGEPGDRRRQLGGVGWIRAADWIPYQRRTFVTPAFPGYVSGHSTFSRAAAEVLTAMTGDAFFPGGWGSYRVEPGYLVFEYGPSAAFELSWATYFDAADQAGQSRLYGGIHVFSDDSDGRKIGAKVGQQAVEFARQLF